jgi:hypothetical protein
MTAFNVVRFRVKPGRDQEFIDAHKTASAESFPGARRFALIKTGDGTYCVIAEWNSFDDIVAARHKMIGLLDGMRDCLEDLGNDLGVTDPVSGETVMETSAAGPKPRRAPVAKRKPASKARATSPRRGKPAAKKPAAKKKAGARASAKKPARKPARKAAAKRGRR